MKPTYETIVAAVLGDPNAIEEVLKAYDPYINTLATFQYFDRTGKEHNRFMPDVKQTLKKKLIEELPKWKEILP